MSAMRPHVGHGDYRTDSPKADTPLPALQWSKTRSETVVHMKGVCSTVTGLLLHCKHAFEIAQ